MKYIKKFNNEAQLDSYKKSNFISPHIYFDSNLNTVKFMQEYKQLEYISSTQTGGQYIDLGCKLMEDTEDIQIDIKFNITNHGKTGVQQSTLIAGQPEVSPYPGFALRIEANASNPNVELLAHHSFTNSTKQNNANRWNSKYLRHSENGTNTLCPWRTIYEFSETIDKIPSSQINNFNCHLFCALNSSNQPFRFIEADLYYLRFKKGGKMVRNLIPVKKISTNEIGLYDIENDHFYISQGDNPFVGGPKV